MDKTTALRSIGYDLVEYIQKKVVLDFDNARQAPVSFVFGGDKHRVGEVLGRFRTGMEFPPNAYLLKVENGQVFFVYFHYYGFDRRSVLHEGNWILGFRIFCDHELMALYREERRMLLNMALKRIVDFHGHLCPDLAIGCKFCEYAGKLLRTDGESNGVISVLAENGTSALDAIQIMLGATVGNQRLRIVDYGKHGYTLWRKNDKSGFRLSLKELRYGDEEEYEGLERKIMADRAVFEDVVRFQALQDDRVKLLLGMGPESVFSVEIVEPNSDAFETPSVLLTCISCGEAVLKSRAISREGEVYCMHCFKNMKTGCALYRLH